MMFYFCIYWWGTQTLTPILCQRIKTASYFIFISSREQKQNPLEALAQNFLTQDQMYIQDAIFDDPIKQNEIESFTIFPFHLFQYQREGTRRKYTHTIVVPNISHSIACIRMTTAYTTTVIFFFPRAVGSVLRWISFLLVLLRCLRHVHGVMYLADKSVDQLSQRVYASMCVFVCVRTRLSVSSDFIEARLTNRRSARQATRNTHLD